MRDHVRFVSARFVPVDEDIAPGTYAMELTRRLREQMLAGGVDLGEPVVEDWGCLLGVNRVDAAWSGSRAARGDYTQSI